MERRPRSGGVRLLTLIVAALGAASCGGDTPVDPTSPSSTPSPPATSSSSPTPTAAEADIFPIGGGQIGQDLPPGTYRAHPGFDVQFSVTVGEGWRSGRDDREGLLTLLQGENSLGRATHWLAFFVMPAETTPDDAIAELQQTPNAQAGEPAATTLGGLAARMIDVQALPNPENAGDDRIEPGTITVPALDDVWPGEWHTESSEASLRVITLDVEGRTFLVYLEAPPDAFDTFAADADSVLATLTFSG